MSIYLCIHSLYILTIAPPSRFPIHIVPLTIASSFSKKVGARHLQYNDHEKNHSMEKPHLDIPEFKAFLLLFYTPFAFMFFFFYCEKLEHVSNPYFCLMPGAIWLGCKSFLSLSRFTFFFLQKIRCSMYTQNHVCRHAIYVLEK